MWLPNLRRRCAQISATLVLIELLGAGALLLWGLRMIKTGMLRAFGSSMRYWIGKSTSNRFSALVVGIVATLAVQSSTATAVITASFAARDLITAVAAQAVMLGANIGTSIAAGILSLKLDWLSPMLILAGVAIFSRSNHALGKGMGRAVLGLGLMLLALALLGQATEPVRASDVVIYLLASLGDAPVFGLIFATLLAMLASSSLAVVLFVVLLGQADVIGPALALVLVAGANLGGAVPPYLAVLREGVEARRLALTNLGIRAVGAAALTGAAPWIAGLAEPLFNGTGQLAIAAHIAFSVILALVFLPVLGPLTRLVSGFMPKAQADAFGPRYLDDSALTSPTIALAAAARETLRLGDLVRDMIEGSMNALKDTDPDAREAITRIEDDIDRLHGEIKTYLARLGREGLDDADMQRATEIMSYAVNLEHIGDIIDSGLSDLAAKKAKRRLRFSPEGMAEITAFYNRTLDILQVAQSVFLSRDPELARELVGCKSEIRRLETESSERHLERLRERRTETIETSGLHLDILRDLKRVNAHLISVAYPILDDMGVLSETRLRPAPEE